MNKEFYLNVLNPSHVHPGLGLVRFEFHSQLVALQKRKSPTFYQSHKSPIQPTQDTIKQFAIKMIHSGCKVSEDTDLGLGQMWQ